ncbi:sensor histidine kinase [Kiloniella majae]|uniref:sensor histidine kinase n=1 Tax=Kiloniella majae TaxID=1938558 RepID=UPI000F789A3A|nr:HAMP domain-containing sensor histidine kinase [Kiloniella majae]
MARGIASVESKRPLSRSLAFRYTTTFIGIFTLVSVTYAVVIYWLAIDFLRLQTDNTIQADTSGLEEYYEKGGLRLLTELLESRLKILDNEEVVYLLTNQDYKPILGNITSWPDDLPKNFDWMTIDRGDGYGYERDLRYHQSLLSNGYRLLVARDTYREDELENLSWLVLTIVLLTTVGLGGVGGFLLHFSIQRRLKLVVDTCEQFAEGRVYQRIQVNKVKDEIDTISLTLNVMLERIGKLMLGIQQVTDNIAHDLKTPLTRLRGRLESFSNDLLKKEGREQDHKEIALALSDVDQLLSTFNSLLRIAQIESGESLKGFAKVELKSLLADAVELYEPILEEQRQVIKLDAKDEIIVVGDRDLLFQCLTNLIDNATKYSNPDSEINLQLFQSDGLVKIVVQDEGEGIPGEELERVFERFYRVEYGRNKPGNGLGLSLVSAVVELHQGKIFLENNQGEKGGLKVIISLPLR